MKIKLLSLLLPAALFSGLCAQAHAETVPPAIKACYDTGIAATEKNDFKPFGALFAPTFVLVDPSGKTVSRAAFLADVRGNMKQTSKETVKLTFGDVKTHDGVVEVPFENTMRLTTPKGLTTTMYEVGVHSWKKIGSTWFIVKTVDKVMDITEPKPATAK